MSHLPAFTQENLDAYYRRADLINQTANQIIKDFEWYGMEIKFSGKEENAYTELFDQIKPAIETLLNNNAEKLMEVLYRIDVNEKKLADAGSDKTNVSEVITDLIIRRELQKVVTRNYFSGRL